MNDIYIKEFIIDSGFLTEEDLERVEEKMFNENLSFLSAVSELGILDQEILNKILTLIQGVPKVSLRNKIIDLETFLLIPEPIARVKKIIPFAVKDNKVYLATSDTNKLDYDFLRNIIPLKYDIEIFLADEDDVNQQISNYQKLLKEGLVSGLVKNLDNISKVKDYGFESEKDLPENFMSDIANNYYAEKFIKELLEYAKTSNASHIYINNGEKEHLISFRIYGENYPIMAIEADTIFSLSMRLKQLADINIFSRKEIIRNVSFTISIQGQVEKIRLSFVKNAFGEAITLELAQNKEFGTEFLTVVSEQKEYLYHNLNDKKGFYIISGESKSGKTKTTYALMEYEAGKNKEIYSLEEVILNRINFTNQILIDKKTKKELLLAKIIQNKPDLISIDYIKPYILKTLFNYVDFGGKIILGIKNDIKTFVEKLMEFDFNKGKVIRNFNILIEHKKFEKLQDDNKKEYYLTKNDLDILKIFISKSEILDLFKKENLVKDSLTKVEKIKFYTKKKKVKNKENHYLRGILDLGVSLENYFLKKYSTEKIKTELAKASKKTVLENALILSNRGEIDIKEVLKYLIKK